MSWNDIAYFAPEALIDDKNRHIVWTWLHGNPENDFEKYGWSGVFGFPRTVWYEDGILKMAPAGELDRLEYNTKTPIIGSDGSVSIANGELFRLKAELAPDGQDKIGFVVQADEKTGNKTEIYYDAVNGKLVFDATNSGIDGLQIKEEAPFKLMPGEKLSLDIFVDKSVIEVYANERQAICRRVYPASPEDAVKVMLVGNQSAVLAITASDMAPTNPY